MIVDSKRWMLAVRIIVSLLAVIQLGLIAWANYVTREVQDNKKAWIEQKSDIANVKENILYIRNRLDTVFELKRRDN